MKMYPNFLKKEVIDGFNVFTITSDLYYRENYHSDILKAFLEYKDSRTGKYPLLESFINMLNVSKRETHTEDYLCPEIIREYNNMDILIKDDNSKHCIIIENKINNAPDMERQLPRYYDDANKELKVDAIVYLTKYPNTFPDKIGWKDGDAENISKVFVSLPVYGGENEVSLLKWIDNTIRVVSDVDVLSTLRQYRQLLHNLEYEMEQFMPTIQLIREMDSTDNFKIQDIISLRDILYRWPEAMAVELRNSLCAKLPEYHICKWEPNSCVIQLQGENRIYVYCELDAQAAYIVYAADFSVPGNYPKWIQQNNLLEDLKEYTDNRVHDKNKIGFEFGYNEKGDAIKLIGTLISIYKSNNKHNIQ